MNELERIGVQTDEEFPYSIIENEILDIEGISANKKLLLIMLRRYAGHGNKPAFPSYKKLMKVTGVKSDDTITKSIRFFEWICFLEKVNRSKDNREKDTNLYIISLKNIRTIIQHFKNYKIKFEDVEKYFDEKYKENKTFYLNDPCKFLKTS